MQYGTFEIQFNKSMVVFYTYQFMIFAKFHFSDENIKNFVV